MGHRSVFAVIGTVLLVPALRSADDPVKPSADRVKLVHQMYEKLPCEILGVTEPIKRVSALVAFDGGSIHVTVRDAKDNKLVVRLDRQLQTKTHPTVWHHDGTLDVAPRVPRLSEVWPSGKTYRHLPRRIAFALTAHEGQLGILPSRGARRRSPHDGRRASFPVRPCDREGVAPPSTNANGFSYSFSSPGAHGADPLLALRCASLSAADVRQGRESGCPSSPLAPARAAGSVRAGPTPQP